MSSTPPSSPSSRSPDRVLPVDQAVIDRWAALPTARTLPVVDSLIAATGLAHGLTVATRDARDFADLGVPTFDPFD
ncbi:PIN domain-containing protein [Microbacterium sp. No. 7]|uniref:PIN domain-containing protein n=1 Tax=Microbacterium sp. No. 7 TaxID=1714373 RepID=UPI0009E95896|nr:PIN domain-containing protein [Microbacterium sp. No. 7]